MKVNILEAKNRLSELVRAAAAGEEVVIANRGVPVAKLVKAEQAPAETSKERAELERRLEAIIAEMHRIPERPDAFNPLEWDERGLPK